MVNQPTTIHLMAGSEFYKVGPIFSSKHPIRWAPSPVISIGFFFPPFIAPFTQFVFRPFIGVPFHPTTYNW